VIFAAAMAWESVGRLIDPEPIDIDAALATAVAGLLVNGVSALILAAPGHHGLSHHHHDHTLRGAHLHVLADAPTSMLAIGALLAARSFDANWLDPVIGVVGAVLVTRWARGLLRDTSRVLLDAQLPADATERCARRSRRRTTTGSRIFAPSCSTPH
jgi:cation diffusion facilitator family transporter